jgi:hypothetical protein
MRILIALLLLSSFCYGQEDPSKGLGTLEGQVVQLDYVNYGTIISVSNDPRGDGIQYVIYVNTNYPVVNAYKALYTDTILKYCNQIRIAENKTLLSKSALEINWNEIEGEALVPEKDSIILIPATVQGIARMQTEQFYSGELIYQAGKLKNEAVLLSAVSVGLIVAGSIINTNDEIESFIPNSLFVGASISSIIALVKVINANKNLQKAGTALIRESTKE